MGSISVKVTSHAKKVTAETMVKMSLATRKAAFDIEAQAKTRAAVDTGNLKNSINANGDGLEWRVDSPAEYSVYVEFGTTRAGAQPFLVPAVEMVRPSFIAALKTLA